MPRSVRLAAWISFLMHGGLILAARYRMSYDAYVHMFFADHYRMDWWSLWDERWYTGFFVTSYPPLVHQLIAALSSIIGLEAAYAIVLWITLTLIPIAVYPFARIFVGKTAAGYASLGAAVLPSVYLTAHIFGQLPFLFGTVLALFGAASLYRYLRYGGIDNFALAVALAATTMAAHHAVLLVQPFLVFAILMKLFLSREATGVNHVSGNTFTIGKLILRLMLFASAAIAFSLLVVFPFWEWGQSQTLQTEIDHASRHNFFTDPFAFLLFFVPMYGPLMLMIPSALFLARQRQRIGLGIVFIFLFILGLGGTTPLPGLLFREGWIWLTYDRFAFWASLMLLPFFGIIVILLRRNYSKVAIQKVFLAMAIFSLVVGVVTTVLPLQPGAVNMSGIVDFLKEDDRADWHYLTFGFGDQLALLSTLTTATTIDGSYHTARTLPELRSSGIAQIDTAFWFPNGLSALHPILERASERGVRWGFVNIPQYIPILEKNGWMRLMTLQGGVEVWENPAAVLPKRSAAPPTNPLASFAWGAFPLLSLLATGALAALRLYPMHAESILRGTYTFLVSLIPLALCFWYYRTLGEFLHPRVYFTYGHALFFIADSLVLLAVMIWLCAKISRAGRSPISNYRVTAQTLSLVIPIMALILFSTLSIFWSPDWRTSLYFSFHLWLVFLFVLSLRDWKEAWRPALLGLCAALAIQLIAGLGGFALQSTSFLDTLNMNWPGLLEPSMRGASVIQLENGFRLLRAYGTLPHPNILAGFVLVCLLGPASLFLRNRKPNYAALILFVFGMILIALTFSRSAWLGLATVIFFLVLKSKFLEARRVWLLAAVGTLTILLALLPLREFVFTRLNGSSVRTEQISTVGRSWLNEQAINIFREQPLTGTGIGSFVLALSKNAVQGAPIEPVHNVALLVGAELGIPGLLLLAVLLVGIFQQMMHVRTPQAILASSTLAGIGMISLFDHYLWSIAPGRVMLGLVLGLWLGQLNNYDA